MDIMIREYRRSDLPFMTEIWNQVVGEGNAFPQEELLGEGEAEAFLPDRPAVEWPRTQSLDGFLGCIFCIPIMWDDAAISVMPVMG